MEHLIKAIKYYLYIRNLENENIRIDVIEVYAKKGEYRFNHIKQVVQGKTVFARKINYVIDFYSK